MKSKYLKKNLFLYTIEGYLFIVDHANSTHHRRVFLNNWNQEYFEASKKLHNIDVSKYSDELFNTLLAFSKEPSILSQINTPRGLAHIDKYGSEFEKRAAVKQIQKDGHIEILKSIARKYENRIAYAYFLDLPEYDFDIEGFAFKISYNGFSCKKVVNKTPEEAQKIIEESKGIYVLFVKPKPDGSYTFFIKPSNIKNILTWFSTSDCTSD